MQDYISISSYNEEDTLTHHGVKGMKWGRRKDRKSSGGIRKKASNIKNTVSGKISSTKDKAKKAISNIDKEKAKKMAKTSAMVAGKVALGIALGSVGGYALSTVYQAMNTQAIRNTKDYIHNLESLGYVYNETAGDWVPSFGTREKYRHLNGS